MLESKFHRRPWLLALTAAALTFLCFLPVYRFEFLNFDDDLYITENEFVKSGITHSNITAALLDTRSGHWHPLTWLSHMLDAELFGLVPGPQHLVNALLHSANTALLFFALYLATGLPAPAFVAALLFGLHPLRIESVAWLSQRKDVLSMFFGLSAMIAYVTYCKYSRRGYYLLMLLLYLLSLLAKPTLVSFGFLLLLLDYWPLKRISLASLIEKLPVLALALSISMIVVYAQAAGAGLRSLEEIPLADRLVGALVSYLAYFGKFFIPSGVAIFYPFTSFAPGIGAGALCGLLALSYCAVRASTRHPYLLLAWLWFLISLLPVIGFVQIGGQIFADRWTYLAHIGLCIGSVWYVRELLRARPKLRFALAALTVLLCFFITRSYLPHWRSSESLFRHTLEVSPHNFMAHTNLGSALDQSGKLDQAAQHYEEAARLNPTYPEALNNLGTLRARQRRLSEAAQLLERALSLRPRFRSARYNLGLVYNDQGNSVAALAAWLQVLELNSNDSAALNSIGFVLNAQLRQPCAASITSSSALDRDKFRQQLRILPAGALQPDLYAGLQQLGRCFD